MLECKLIILINICFVNERLNSSTGDIASRSDLIEHLIRLPLKTNKECHLNESFIGSLMTIELFSSLIQNVEEEH